MSECSQTSERVGSASFFEEFWSLWREIPSKGCFFGLLFAWVVMFHFLGNSTFNYVDSPSIFRWMYSFYSRSEFDDSHGLLIPLVVLVVLWWRRGRLLALPRKSWHPALGMLALAVALHLLGFAAQQTRLSIVSFFFGIYALVGLTWGRDWLKATFMPFSIFVFCVPVSSLEIIKNLTMPLQLLATAISTGVAHEVLGFEVTRRGTQIFDAAGVARYDVGAACSGIRSLISLFVLMTVFGMLNYRSLWRRFVLMLISVPLALFCNVLRLISVIIAGQVFGVRAGEVAHEYSGFFTYAIAIACMVLLSRWWSEKPLPQTAALFKS